jgi:parallel beta-helix repeat protein
MSFLEKLLGSKSSSHPQNHLKRRPVKKQLQRIHLAAEMLEDRLTPTVSAMFDMASGTLTVDLSAPGDQAFVRDTGGAIDVGTTNGGHDVLAGQTGVQHIIVQDTGANANQAVTFNGSTPFAASVQTTGIETGNVNEAITGTVTGDATTVNVTTPGTIQNGINLAASGATVNVAAGTYTEDISISKSLTLDGAQAGVDARGSRSGGESTILGTGASGPVAIGTGTNNVTIDGFTINSPASGSGAMNAGITTSGSTGITIRNNIIQNNTAGIAIAAGSSGTITQNLIETNNAPGAGSGNGVEFVTPGTANWLVQHNRFTGNNNADVLVAAGGAVSGVTIDANDFVNSTGNPVALIQASGTVVSNNHISGAAFSGVALGGGDTNVQITGNTFTDDQARAIVVQDAGFGGGSNSNVTIGNNIITQNVNVLNAGTSMIVLNGVAGTSSVSGNRIILSGTTNATVPVVNGIDISGPLTGTMNVSLNLLEGSNADTSTGANANAGLRLENSLPATATINATQNTITGFVDGVLIDTVPSGITIAINQNNILLNSQAGLDNLSSATVNATNDFWGSPSGPTVPSNPGGTGDAILEATTGSVNYQPFLNHVALPFYDLFTQPNGAALSGAWKVQAGAFSIQNSQLSAGQAGTANVATLVNLSSADVGVEADLNFTGTGSAALVARYTGSGIGTGAQMYWAGVSNSGGQSLAEIWVLAGGQWRMLTSAPVANPVGHYRFEVFGNSLQLFLNGALVGLATDSTLTAGSAGVWGAGGALFDNFTARATPFVSNVLPFDETFTQANGTVLDSSWTQVSGNFTVQNNQAQATGAGENYAILNNVVVADALVQADITLPSGNVSAGVVLRSSGQDNQNMYWAGIARSNGQFIASIWVKQNGSWIQLSPAAPLSGFSGSGTLRFEAYGTDLKLFVNGSLAIFAHDSRLTTGTVGMWSGHGATFDNFHAEQITPENASLPFGPDTFTQPNGSSPSRVWRETEGAFQVQNNQLVSFPTGSSAAILNGVSAQNVTVSMDVTINSSGSAALLARATPDDQNMYWAGITRNGNSFTADIWVKLNGSWHQLASQPLSVVGIGLTGSTLSGTLRFQVNVNSLQLFFNNNLVASAMDSSLTAAGTIGLWAGNGNAVDNFAASSILVP